MEQAIKLAIEKGGYKIKFERPDDCIPFGREECRHKLDICRLCGVDNIIRKLEQEITALDPLFWQALGKALGWEERHCSCNGYSSQCKCDFTWLVQAHEFFEIKLTGGDTEKFWQELIK